MKHSQFYKAFPEYYDAEYSQTEMLHRDVPMFVHQLPKRRQNILELAAGTGRAAIPIAQAGHRVVGIDYDAGMVRIARQKRDAVGLADSHLKLIRADALKFNLKEKFDWICIFFNTFLNFTTLPEQDGLLQTVRRHLKPCGRFWLDIFQPNLDLLARDHCQHLDPTTFYVPALDRTVHRDTEVHRDAARQVQQVTYHYLWFDGDGVEHRQQVDFELTWLFPRELQLLLERNGLRIEQSFGDHDGSRLTKDSPRIIVRCQHI